MKIAAILFDTQNPELASALSKNSHIEEIFHCGGPGGADISLAFERAGGRDYALVIPSSAGISVSEEDTARLIEAARESGAGLAYADYLREGLTVRLAGYQPGSIRDDFSFGPAQLYSLPAVKQAFERCGALSTSCWAGLYELRLKVSSVSAVLHVPEPCSRISLDQDLKKSQFAYVDPRQLSYQKEMERVATEHLRRIGAWCGREPLPAPEGGPAFPVTASIVIPVRNRERTIAEAVRSALSQKADFPFNVIVAQNHSADRTASIMDELAAADSRVIHLVPRRTDLGIGGCWNEAVQSPQCGRYACQLDSDDLYSDGHTLAKLVAMLRDGKCGMVVGSYRLVNFRLEELPPGIIDHREWSDDNGRNNLLRVNGIGAPRAFATALLRRFPFPNVSYGEDYAAALRISRDYRVGRIYEPLYLCRRWEDNTDAGLSNEQEVRYAEYKDGLRTAEIRERQAINT